MQNLPQNITAEEEGAIQAARDAYNALPTELREKVTNLDKLHEAEKTLKTLKRPAAGKNGYCTTETNLVKAKVVDGVVSAKQLEKVRGKELVLQMQGTMESGEAYILSIYGKLAENAEIFRFVHAAAFPGAMLVDPNNAKN